MDPDGREGPGNHGDIEHADHALTTGFGLGTGSVPGAAVDLTGDLLFSAVPPPALIHHPCHAPVPVPSMSPGRRARGIRHTKGELEDVFLGRGHGSAVVG